jgi:hypothetical protein
MTTRFPSFVRQGSGWSAAEKACARCLAEQDSALMFTDLFDLVNLLEWMASIKVLKI